jgi:hypothetical protein
MKKMREKTAMMEKMRKKILPRKKTAPALNLLAAPSSAAWTNPTAALPYRPPLSVNILQAVICFNI